MASSLLLIFIIYKWYIRHEGHAGHKVKTYEVKLPSIQVESFILFYQD